MRVALIFFTLLSLPSDSKSNCSCPNIYQPVCGVNGITYPSRCHLSCASTTLLSSGPCAGQPSGYVPTQNSQGCPQCVAIPTQPVCGSGGVTYDNQCILQCRGASLLYQGSCNPASTSQYPNTQYPNTQYPNPQYPNPQYPNTQYPNPQYPNTQYPNTQYPNTQYPNTQYPSTQYPPQTSFSSTTYPSTNPGSPVVTTPTSCYCADIDNQVCGTDNRTYQNECVLACARQTLLRSGACSTGANVITPALLNSATSNASAIQPTNPINSSISGCNCPPSGSQVCATTRVTYANICEMSCRGGILAHAGPCARRLLTSFTKLK